MIPIGVTESLGCPRGYQYKLEKVGRLPPHFYNMRGNLLHYVLERRFKSRVEVGQINILIEEFLDSFKKWGVDEESHLGKELSSSFFDLSENVAKWFDETELDVSKENILVIEEEMSMPIRGDYWLVGHPDVITKTHIIDFKSGRMYRNYDHMKQLGAYRDLARYLGTHDYSLTGDFELVNVYFGEKGNFGEVFHPYSDIDRVMPEFYGSLFDLIGEDKKWREIKGYMMPCRLGVKCAFCDWRHECRGK